MSDFDRCGLEPIHCDHARNGEEILVLEPGVFERSFAPLPLKSDYKDSLESNSATQSMEGGVLFCVCDADNRKRASASFFMRRVQKKGDIFHALLSVRPICNSKVIEK